MKAGPEIGYSADVDFRTLTPTPQSTKPDGTFTDSRDGRIYGYKKIGTQTWMTDNLAWLPIVSPDTTFSLTEKRYYVSGYQGTDTDEAKKSENYQKYGTFYNWPAAMNGEMGKYTLPTGRQGSCPDGWHLPADEEWILLEKNLGMNSSDLKLTGLRTSGNVDKKLKSDTGWEDDDILTGNSGFNMLPAGAISVPDRKSIYLNFAAYFWTSTSESEKNAHDRYLFLFTKGIFRVHVPRSLGHSVRCIKN